MFFYWSPETQNRKQNTLQESFPNDMIIFEGFRISWFIWQSIFRPLLNAPYLNPQLVFCKSNVNKTV